MAIYYLCSSIYNCKEGGKGGATHQILTIFYHTLTIINNTLDILDTLQTLDTLDTIYPFSKLDTLDTLNKLDTLDTFNTLDSLDTLDTSNISYILQLPAMDIARLSHFVISQ